jgi:DNA-binding MarR family transcriptional regulator
MDTKKLTYFSVLARTENIRKSSEILNITPSALSKIVKQLEEELGVTLLSPSGRGIVLTAEGRELGKRSALLVESFETLKRDLTKSIQDKKEAPIRIATFEVFSTHFLQVFENVNLENRKLIWHESGPGEIEQAIADNKVDYGITYIPIPLPGVDHIKITSILMGVYKLIGSFEKSAQEELPFVVPVFPIHGAPSRIKGCAGYFPSFIIERHNQKFKEKYHLVRHPNTKILKRCYSDVYLIKRKDQSEDKDLKWIAKLIRLGTKINNID